LNHRTVEISVTSADPEDVKMALEEVFIILKRAGPKSCVAVTLNTEDVEPEKDEP